MVKPTTAEIFERQDADNQVDHSKWSTFFDEEVVYFSTTVLEKMIQDLVDEKNARKTEKQNANS